MNLFVIQTTKEFLILNRETYKSESFSLTFFFWGGGGGGAKFEF